VPIEFEYFEFFWKVLLPFFGGLLSLGVWLWKISTNLAKRDAGIAQKFGHLEALSQSRNAETRREFKDLLQREFEKSRNQNQDQTDKKVAKLATDIAKLKHGRANQSQEITRLATLLENLPGRKEVEDIRVQLAGVSSSQKQMNTTLEMISESLTRERETQHGMIANRVMDNK